MGTKFAHFTVLDSNFEEVKGLLKHLPKSTLNFETVGNRLNPGMGTDLKVKLSEAAKTDKSASYLLQELLMPKYVCYVSNNNKGITVFSENFSFESIDNFTLNISNHSPSTFVTAADFDDDVFVFSIIKDGKMLSHHVTGGEFYDMEDTPGDIDIIANTFNIPLEKGKLEKILKNKNVMEKIPELGKLLDMELWITREVQKDKSWKKVVVSASGK